MTRLCTSEGSIAFSAHAKTSLFRRAAANRYAHEKCLVGLTNPRSRLSGGLLSYGTDLSDG